jgi:hypothetical protein
MFILLAHCGKIYFEHDIFGVNIAPLECLAKKECNCWKVDYDKELRAPT